MNLPLISQMTAEEARKATESIKNGLVELRQLFLDVYERDGWKALGYSNFVEYAETEFDYSKSRAYQLIDAAEVERNLRYSTIVENRQIPESHLRPLTSLPSDQQPIAYQHAVDTAPNGKVTAAHVQKVVDEYDEQAEELSQEPDGYDWSEEEVEPVNIEDSNGHVETVWVEPSKMAVHFSSDTPEHYTPKDVVEAVVACLGSIDLDPCSNSKTEPNIPAATHYTIKDDGLSQIWTGKVYMNPPYGREIGKWIVKLCDEYEAGNVTEAIALVPARTDTAWFYKLINGYKLICFVEGRLQFIGNDANAPFPSAIVYLGTDLDRFFYTFSPFGCVVQELNPEMFGA